MGACEERALVTTQAVIITLSLQLSVQLADNCQELQMTVLSDFLQI